MTLDSPAPLQPSSLHPWSENEARLCGVSYPQARLPQCSCSGNLRCLERSWRIRPQGSRPPVPGRQPSRHGLGGSSRWPVGWPSTWLGAWGSGQGWHPVFLDDVGRVFTAWGLPAIAPTLSGETAWREALEGFWREVISLPRASVSPPTPFLGKQPLGGRSHAQLDWEVLCSDLPSLAAPPV